MAYTATNPVAIGAATKKSHFDTLWDNVAAIWAGLVGKVTITQPATGSTLTIADGKTLTVSETSTLTTELHVTAPATHIADAATGFTIAGGTTSKTLTVSEASILFGTVRSLYLLVKKGSAGTHVYLQTFSICNGDVCGQEDLDTGEDGTNFTRTGTNVLTIKNAGIAGDVVGIYAVWAQYNDTTLNFMPNVSKSAAGIVVEALNPTTGSNFTWSELIAAGTSQVQICITYLTSG